MSFNSSRHTALAARHDIVDVLDPGHLAAGGDIHLERGPALIWIARGAVKLEWRTLHGRWGPLLLHDGDFYLSTSELIQLRRAHQCQADFEGIRLHISTNVLHRCAIESGVTTWRGHDIKGTADRTLRSLLELLCPVRSERTSLSTPFIDGIAQAVIARLMSYPTGALREQGCNSRGLAPYKFRMVSQVMRERLTEPFDLEHLAGLAGLSTFHFSRTFKKTSGLAPSRYFQRLRIEQAKRMLSDDNQSIIDIAMAVGFRSPSHFSQVFREVAGVSPSEYRNRLDIRQGRPKNGPTTCPPDCNNM